MPTRPISGYDNEEIPDSMPLQNQDAIPVIVRLVDSVVQLRLGPGASHHGIPERLVQGAVQCQSFVPALTSRRPDQRA
jgi:hypothetical protein